MGFSMQQLTSSDATTESRKSLDEASLEYRHYKRIREMASDGFFAHLHYVRNTEHLIKI